MPDTMSDSEIQSLLDKATDMAGVVTLLKYISKRNCSCAKKLYGIADTCPSCTAKRKLEHLPLIAAAPSLIAHLLKRAQDAEANGFVKSFAEIRRLIAVNAKHRGGWRIADVTKDMPVIHAKQELKEMFDCASGSVEEQKELADVLGCLFHLILKRGWTPEEIQTVMLAKFKERFTE